MPLSAALESSDAEMTKRLKYTKDILTTMLNNGANTNGAGNNGNQQAAPQTPVSAQMVPGSAGGPLTTIGSRRSEQTGRSGS